MGDSLFLPSNVQMDWQASVGNLLIAKAMHDQGYPLPGEWDFDYDECQMTLFYRAISFLFGSTDYEDDGNGSVEVTILEMPEWGLLKSMYPEISNDEQWIIEPVKELSSDYTFANFECELSGEGFVIREEGFGSEGFSFIKDYVEFKERFYYKLNVWREHHASIRNVETRRNANSVA